MGCMGAGLRLRMVLNWLNLSTPLGLLLAAGTRCVVVHGAEGLIYACGYRPKLPLAGAFAVGNVVLFRAGPDYPPAHPVLVRHEGRHSTQYAICLGLPFLPLYFLGVLWSFLRTGDPASRNPFERWAGLADGGYAERPVRPLRPALAQWLRQRCRPAAAPPISLTSTLHNCPDGSGVSPTPPSTLPKR
jgi:hypothetical protein